MRKHIYISIFLLSILTVFQGLAQKKYPDLRAALFSTGKLSGSNGPASVNWINKGEAYSFSGGDGIIKSFNPKTKKEETIFEASKVTFPDGKPFRYRSFQWSADSKYLLFQTNFRQVYRNSGDADYYFYDTADKSLRLVAKDARTAELSPNGKMVGFEREGNLFIYDFATKKETQLTTDGDPSRDVVNGRYGWAYEEEFGLVQAWKWSKDSKYIAYWQSDESKVPTFQMTNYDGQRKEWVKIKYPQVGDTNPSVKIAVVDIASKSNQWLDVDLAEGYIPRIYWTAKQGTLAVIHLNRKQTELKLFFSDVKTGKSRLIMQEKARKGWIDLYDFFAGILDLFFFPEDKEEFFWVSDRDGWSHIYRFDYNGKVLNQVTKGKWEVVYVHSIDSKKKLIYYSSTEASPLERHLYVIDFKGKNKKRLTKAEGKHSIDLSPNSKYYIDRYSNINLPKQVELWTTTGKKIKTLEDNKATKDFIKNGYAKKELMSFTTKDNQKLDLYLIKPTNFDESKSYPLVLNIYGGPGAQSVYNEFATNAWEQYLAQEGYVIVSVNNRGSGGYGSDFEKRVYENLGDWESKDFVETVQYLAKTYSWVDGERMAIRGHSYGGYMSSLTMLKYPDVFKVAIVGAPVTDWRLYDSIYAERYMGLSPENDKAYEESSPTTYAKNLEGKMLLVHSTSDENVHVQNTFQLVSALIENGKDVDLRIYPKGAHGVAYDLPSYILLYQQYVDYLNEHLK